MAACTPRLVLMTVMSTDAPKRRDDGTAPNRQRHHREQFAEVVPKIARIASHVVVWIAVLVPVAIVIARGFLPFWDDALVTIRAHEVFSLHSPGVGPQTTTSTAAGGILFDPGPLMFWILAIPVRLSSVNGALVGSAVAGGIALSVAVEAAWSKRLWVGCLGVAFAAADTLWLLPTTRLDPLWNAFFPIPFLISSIVLAWIVASGSLWWSPVLVVMGSVAIQTHLINLAPCVLLIVLAPIVGLLRMNRTPRWWWLLGTAGAVVFCWIAPVIENFGPRGNLSALLASGHGVRRLGATSGLDAAGSLLDWPPLWLHHMNAGFFQSLGAVFNHSSSLGVGLLIALLVVAGVSWWKGQVALSSLSIVALAVTLGMAISFAIIPVSNVLNVTYIQVELWPASILVAATFGWTALWAVRALAAQLGQPLSEVIALRMGAVGGVVAMGLVVWVLVLGLVPLRSWEAGSNSILADRSQVHLTREIANEIERESPKGHVVYKITGPEGFWGVVGLTEGVAWRLAADGWQPGLYGSEQIDTSLYPTKDASAFKVVTKGGTLISVTPVSCPSVPRGCKLRP